MLSTAPAASRESPYRCISEVVKKALANGPQIVTKRGVETVIVLSVKEYRNLKRPKNSLVDFFKDSPLRDMDIDMTRSKEPAREIDL